jgi:hypothetical protein
VWRLGESEMPREKDGVEEKWNEEEGIVWNKENEQVRYLAFLAMWILASVT